MLKKNLRASLNSCCQYWLGTQAWQAVQLFLLGPAEQNLKNEKSKNRLWWPGWTWTCQLWTRIAQLTGGVRHPNQCWVRAGEPEIISPTWASYGAIFRAARAKFRAEFFYLIFLLDFFKAILLNLNFNYTAHRWSFGVKPMLGASWKSRDHFTSLGVLRGHFWGRTGPFSGRILPDFFCPIFLSHTVEPKL